MNPLKCPTKGRIQVQEARETEDGIERASQVFDVLRGYPSLYIKDLIVDLVAFQTEG